MKSYQVVGIGNAIVDVFASADDSFLELMGITKGIMQLVERERGEVLYGAMPVRFPTRNTWVSTACVGSPNHICNTTFAVFRPTPGSDISAARLDGTSPPKRSISSSDRRITLRALVR